MKRQRLKGVVSGFSQRAESSASGIVLVWNFRLERRDEGGKPLPRTSVEMRGRRFIGSVNNGDVVELEGDPDALNSVREIRNLTSRVKVSATRRWNWLLTAIRFAAFVVVLVFVGSIALTIIERIRL